MSSGTAKEQLQQPYGALDISTQELRECQKQDDTLAGIRRVAEANDDDEKSFLERGTTVQKVVSL